MERMLDRGFVRRMFSLFSDLEGMALERWEPLWESRAAALEKRLRKAEIRPEDMERLCSAAGAWAYCDYLVVAGASPGRGETRVGDITLKESGGGAGEAKGIRDHFLEGVADLLEPGFPVFRAVENGEKEKKGPGKGGSRWRAPESGGPGGETP